MKGFILSLRSEFYKSRKTLGFWGSIVLPLLIVGLVFIGYATHKFDANTTKMPGMMLWLGYVAIVTAIMGNLLLPFYVIFIAYSVNSIEHKADTWKTLFTLPIAKWWVYAAKYFYTLFLLFTCLFLFYGLLICTGNLLGILKPELHFADYSVAAYLGQLYLKLFLASLGILSIQFLLSLLWGDFLKPMGIGFLGLIAGWITLGVKWQYVYLIPYAHPNMVWANLQAATKTVKSKTIGAMPNFTIEIFTREVWVSLVFAAVIFVAGFFIVQRKSVK
ncbi:ABC transporter permease [Mucilaginibacter sp. HMF5004]|uniref:ABC transporter permease n=1 Tax=Mucilaginibacter rivuli TaxID=2857527 RepID=UPI001C5E0114|nr:ABC transporter permease [Mucilaginibacter rivuli]MBW4890486.1 ABC transporter permease [Mucilaginibacter rivuli]